MSSRGRRIRKPTRRHFPPGEQIIYFCFAAFPKEARNFLDPLCFCWGIWKCYMNIRKYRVALELLCYKYSVLVRSWEFRSGVHCVRCHIDCGNVSKVWVLCIADNDSEDEGATIKVRRKMTGVTEAAGQPEDYPEDTCNAANDEEGTGKADHNTCEHVGGVDLISEEESRQTDSGSMSSRSESKPYSSVTHKCEVRCFCLLESFCTGNQTHFCLCCSITAC